MLRLTALALLMMPLPWAMAQAPGASEVRLETVAMTGGGDVVLSADHRAWVTVGQTTPTTADLAGSTSPDHTIQPGLIPTLYPRRLPGDTDDDGSLTAPDVVLAVNRGNLPEETPLSVEGQFNADLNFDLRVDAADANGIAERIVGTE